MSGFLIASGSEFLETLSRILKTPKTSNICYLTRFNRAPTAPTNEFLGNDRRGRQ